MSQPDDFVRTVNRLMALGIHSADLRTLSDEVLKAVTELTRPKLFTPPRAAVLVPHPSGGLQLAFYHPEQFQPEEHAAILRPDGSVAGACFRCGNVVYLRSIKEVAVQFDFRNTLVAKPTRMLDCTFQSTMSGVPYSSLLCLPIEGPDPGSPLGVLSLDASEPLLGARMDRALLNRVRSIALVLGLTYSRYYAEWKSRLPPRA